MSKFPYGIDWWLNVLIIPFLFFVYLSFILFLHCNKNFKHVYKCLTKIFRMIGFMHPTIMSLRKIFNVCFFKGSIWVIRRWRISPKKRFPLSPIWWNLSRIFLYIYNIIGEFFNKSLKTIHVNIFFIFFILWGFYYILFPNKLKSSFFFNWFFSCDTHHFLFHI